MDLLYKHSAACSVLGLCINTEAAFVAAACTLARQPHLSPVLLQQAEESSGVSACEGGLSCSMCCSKVQHKFTLPVHLLQEGSLRAVKEVSSFFIRPFVLFCLLVCPFVCLFLCAAAHAKEMKHLHTHYIIAADILTVAAAFSTGGQQQPARSINC